ncbi:MAG: VCBS repeat-containing protein [Planctomycetes bacterium]|nr:VCBS repeat-containing protein [Planctomycetota bacterium]
MSPGELEGQLRVVPSPFDAGSALTPLRLEARRALEEAGPALTALLTPHPETLADADPEFSNYLRDHLLPRILAPWTAVSDDEVFAVDLDGDGRDELVVVATWRDTFFFHDLRFVAILRPDARGRHRVMTFQRLRSIIDRYGLLDVDGDGTPEVVVWHRAQQGPLPWQVAVLSGAGGVVAWHHLASLEPIRHLPTVSGFELMITGPVPGIQDRYAWSHAGFQRIETSR